MSVQTDDTPDECVCVFPDEGYPDGYPDSLPEQCMDKGPEFVCTREPGHDGPHVACSPNGHDHRLGEWGPN